MRPVLRTAAALALLLACGDDPTQPQYDPQLDPADFVPQVTNQFFPLVPGTTYSYEGETDEGTEASSFHARSPDYGVAPSAAHKGPYHPTAGQRTIVP